MDRNRSEWPRVCQQEGRTFAVRAPSTLVSVRGGCRSCGRQVSGRLGPPQLQQFPVTSGCLLHILVLKNEDI